jgi:5-methylcytosine-specific restriction endonuclease McrA
MADFLIALADFDRRRGWEALGHASLFAFLHVELKLPNPSAYWRMSAARVLQRFPELIAPLRDGRLCCSATAELAKVLTDENMEAVLPRFFGLSAREAQEVVAELQPREAPATRTVVTGAPQITLAPLSFSSPILAAAPSAAAMPSLPLHPDVAPPSQLRTSEVAFGGGERTHTPRDETEPLTADLRRLHVTVTRRLLSKIDAARDGLSHAIPGATTEQVLEEALDLLLEKQARARGLVKRPRKTVAPTPTPTATPSATLIESPTQTSTESPPHRRDGHREAIPAAVKRAVWQRDQGRCAWPLDSGGCCGSTHHLELDHVVPWARWSEPTVANLRLTCAHHNGLAARQAFGERFMGRYRGVREPLAAYAAVDRPSACAG